MSRWRTIRRRAGAALLEAIVALAVFGTAGSAALLLMRDGVRAAERARAAEREMRHADAFLATVSLWTREDLDRRLGERPQGPWRLVILRRTPMLYDVALRDSLTDVLVLRTALHRAMPEIPDDPR